MTRKDKQFFSFVGVWLATHMFGFAMFGAAYPGFDVNMGFITVFALWTAALYVVK